MIKVKLQPCARMPEYDEKNRLKLYPLAVNASRNVPGYGRGYTVKVYTGVSMSGVFDFDISESGYPESWYFWGVTQDQEAEMPGIVLEFCVEKFTDESWDFFNKLSPLGRPCLYATPADEIRPRIFEVKTDTEKMKTYQLIRNLKNTWVDEDQAAKIFNVSTEDMSYFLWLGGGSEIAHRWKEQNSLPEYRLYEIAQAIGSECQKVNNQNLWLKVALWVVSIILAFSILYASIY